MTVSLRGTIKAGSRPLSPRKHLRLRHLTLHKEVKALPVLLKKAACLLHARKGAGRQLDLLHLHAVAHELDLAVAAP